MIPVQTPAVAGETAAPGGNGLDFFERIVCLLLTSNPDGKRFMEYQFDRIGIGQRVEWARLNRLIVESRVSLAHAHREIVASAVDAGVRRLLVIEEGVIFTADAGARLHPAVEELAGQDWHHFLLGMADWGHAPIPVPGCGHIARPAAAAQGCFALAYSISGMNALLDTLPESVPRLADWAADVDSIDNHLRQQPDRFVATLPVASQPHLLPYADPALRMRYVA